MGNIWNRNWQKYQALNREKYTPKRRDSRMSLLKWITTKSTLTMSRHRGLPRPFEPKAFLSQQGQEDTQNGCHKEGLLEEHLNSQAFRKSFSKARLKKYRESLQLPIIDNIRPGGKEKLSIEGKIAFLGPTKDIDDILEAFIKVTKNIDKLT